jgi:hypothetical protein
MLSTEWLSAFAPVGAHQGDHQWWAAGAGVFFLKPPIVWLITANHVVEEVGTERVSVLVTPTIGSELRVVPVGKILNDRGGSWVRDRSTDLAAAPMPLSVEFDLKAITSEVCLKLADVVPSMPCFTIGCPYGLRGVNPEKAIPLVLDGIISGVDPTTRRIVTSAPTFPGNSGGPLIAIRSPFTPDGVLTPGAPTVLLAGIMLGTMLVRSPVPGDRTPPLHLGSAAPIDAVIELLMSEEAQTLESRIGPVSGADASPYVE